MEISAYQIARLVLGYLKSEKCTTAFNEFLSSSKYLTEEAKFLKNGKYFATRVNGLSLEDIVKEYSEITFIVHGVLEQSSFFEENHKMTLVEQLLHIFDNVSVPRSKNNMTPSVSSPIVPQKSADSSNKSLFNEHCSPIEQVDRANISKVLSQTLMEKSDLHEKLADAINSSLKNQHGDTNIGTELDDKIKTIVENAEKDPIFDEILCDIIGQQKMSNSNSSKCQVKTSNIYNVNNPDIRHQVITTLDTESESKSTDFEIPTTTVSTQQMELVVLKENFTNATDKEIHHIQQPPPQGQIYVANSSGLLMVPSFITAPNCLMLKNNVTNITDSDIMKMPTIILNGELPAPQVYTEAIPQTKCKTILPKLSEKETSSCQIQYKLVTEETCAEVPETNKDADRTQTRKEKPLKRDTSRKGKLKKLKKDKPSLCTKKSNSLTPKNNTNNKSSSRPASHIRTLHFNSPEKEKKVRAKEKIETSKSGVECSSKSWDSDLRNILKPQIVLSESDESDDSCVSSESIKYGAKLIEETFKTPVKETQNVQTESHLEQPSVDSNQAESKSECPAENEVTVNNEIQEGPLLPENEHTNELTQTVVKPTELHLRNCNGPSRFRKKCNNVKNKHSCVSVEYCSESTSKNKDVKEEKTPEMDKNSVVQKNADNAAKTSMSLDTPVKMQPDTPSTKAEMTPLCKVLEEQIQGIDLLSMPTPSFPVTPSFPITPSLNLCTTPVPFNRPTDYSTSSSYYQPSDTEQNKSLEVLIEECKKLEERKDHIEVAESKGCNDEKTNLKEVTQESTTKSQEIKILFNKSVVGKKNLNLMRSSSSSSSSSSRSSSDSDSSSAASSKSSDDSDFSPANTTVIKKEAYCLRTRAPTPKLVSKKQNVKPVNIKVTKANPKPKNARIQSIIKTLIETQEKTVSVAKKEKKPPAKKKNTPKRLSREKSSSSQKNLQTSETMINPNPVIEENSVTKTTPKPEENSPCPVTSTAEEKITEEQKSTPKDGFPRLDMTEAENDISDNDFALHLSTDDETINKPPAVVNDESCEKPTETNEQPCDGKAEKLVQELKERGIHLVHKKTPDDSPVKDLINENISSAINANAQETKMNDIRADPELNVEDPGLVFDTQHFDGPTHEFICDDHIKSKRKVIMFPSLVGKKFGASVYIESLDQDITRIMTCTAIETIFELAPEKNIKPARKRSKSQNSQRDATEIEKSKKPLVNNDSNIPKRITGLDRKPKTSKRTVKDEGSSDTKQKPSPRSLLNLRISTNANSSPGSKRKSSLSGNETAGKKCKTEEQEALLKKTNVDIFLNKVHGRP